MLTPAYDGLDRAFSMEPAEMSQHVIVTERVQQALGKVSYGATKVEKKSIVFRRSHYVVKVLKGDIF
jgi:sialic acid synthase SpsE